MVEKTNRNVINSTTIPLFKERLSAEENMFESIPNLNRPDFTGGSKF